MRSTAPLVLLAVLWLTGCGQGPPPSPPPLTVADWEALSVDQKYTAEALERLKQGNPKLQTAEGWDEFNRTTLAKNRKRDFPRGQPPPKK